MKLYVYSTTSTFVALLLLGSFSKATTLTPVRFSMPVPIVVPAKIHQFKSFHEWKASMVGAAEAKARQTQDAVMIKQRSSASASPMDPNANMKGGSEAGLSAQIQQMQNQLEKDEFQVSIAKDLTISDYFVGYLTKQKDLSAAITEVSGRLTAEEVAELMAAYANNFFSSQPVSTNGTKAPARAGSNQ